MKLITLPSLFVCFSSMLLAQSVALDSSFGTNGVVTTTLKHFGHPYSIDLSGLEDGKVVMCGITDGYLAIEKYDHLGLLDTAFSKQIFEVFERSVGISSLKNGQLLIVGTKSISGYNTLAFRVDTAGNLDASFGSSGIVQMPIVHDEFYKNIFEQEDGKVIVFGSKHLPSFKSIFTVVRLLENGQTDSTFGIQGECIVDIQGFFRMLPVAGLEQPDHKLLFAGLVDGWHPFVLRINPDGTVDSTFGVGGMVIETFEGEAYGIALQSEGKILITGYTLNPDRAIVVRYNSDGTRDDSFGDQGSQYLLEAQEGVGIAVLPNGKILTANWDFNDKRVVLALLLPNGQRDSSFGENGVYRTDQLGIRPRSMVLNGNFATVSVMPTTIPWPTSKLLLRFLLNFNVGTLDPNQPTPPSLWLYPNPITEQFTIQFGLTEPAQVSVYLFDLQGKLVHVAVQNQSFEHGDHALDLSCPSYLPAGNYILTMEVAGKKMSSIQIMKK